MGDNAMKRNKRTETMGHEDLAPLTEYILSRMGAEGAEIRKRLKKFYRRRALVNLPFFKEHVDKSA
jgi:hypothetical protein